MSKIGIANILVIEDDVQLTFFTKTLLEREGYNIKIIHNGSQALLEVYNEYDLVILDLDLPEINGIEICKKIRDVSDIPIIIFTANDKVYDRIRCLESGANDFISKPVELPELLGRISTHLRTKIQIQALNEQEKFYFQDLSLCIKTRETLRKNTIIHLSPKEFDILLYFMKNPNKTITKNDIFQEVWKNEIIGLSDKKVIDEHLNKLRKKIHLKETTKILHTIYGIGYIMK